MNGMKEGSMWGIALNGTCEAVAVAAAPVAVVDAPDQNDARLLLLLRTERPAITCRIDLVQVLRSMSK